jgi:hypothetical protein
MDPLFQKVRAFTDLENDTLLIWVQALNANLNAEAMAVLDAGLYAEHLRSVLAPDAVDWTPEQANEYARATSVFRDVQDRVNRALTALEGTRAAGDPLQGSGGGEPGGGTGYGK